MTVVLLLRRTICGKVARLLMFAGVVNIIGAKVRLSGEQIHFRLTFASQSTSGHTFASSFAIDLLVALWLHPYNPRSLWYG